jgi:serine/threonine protein kinase/CheY-like chemotaxis protein
MREGSHTFLIVDDEADVRESLRHRFDRDYRVLTAKDGDQAIEILGSHEVQIILSDQRMPGMTGVEFLRHARRLKPTAIRMLATGYADIRAVLDAAKEGLIFRYILKPWDADELAVAIQQAADQHDLLASLRRSDHAPQPTPSGPATADVRADQIAANVQIGDFRIEKRLGAGGMGIVYLARQVSLDRAVALKFLGPALSLQADKARFQREARAIAKLDHPGIASVYFIGQDQQVCYIAMEYIDGPSLRSVIDRLARAEDEGMDIDAVLAEVLAAATEPAEERFDLPTATYVPQQPGGDEGRIQRLPADRVASPTHIRRCCEIVRDAASALDHAHRRGVIHRDIKPGNLLLDRRGAVHVIDFGLARHYEDNTVTQTGDLIGTPMYMSPEQVSGRLELDGRTDIYSLGLVLYELLTLRRPFLAPNREGILRQIVSKPMPPVGRHNPAVSRDLEGVVHKAIARDPDERYPTAAAFAGDLGHWLAGEPVVAPRYRGTPDRREIAAERPGEVTSIALLFFMLGIASGLRGVIATLRLVESIRAYPGQSPFGSITSNLSFCTRVWLLAIGGGAAGSGLLAGRRWAKALALAYCVGVPVVIFPIYEPAIVITLSLVFVLIIPILLRRRMREWFRLAAEFERR